MSASTCRRNTSRRARCIRQGRDESDRRISAASNQVFAVGGGALLVCQSRGLMLELIRALAARKPSRAVCLEAGFADGGQLKANAVRTFKTNVVVFKTV